MRSTSHDYFVCVQHKACWLIDSQCLPYSADSQSTRWRSDDGGYLCFAICVVFSRMMRTTIKRSDTNTSTWWWEIRIDVMWNRTLLGGHHRSHQATNSHPSYSKKRSEPSRDLKWWRIIIVDDGWGKTNGAKLSEPPTGTKEWLLPLTLLDVAFIDIMTRELLYDIWWVPQIRSWFLQVSRTWSSSCGLIGWFGTCEGSWRRKRRCHFTLYVTVIVDIRKGQSKTKKGET